MIGACLVECRAARGRGRRSVRSQLVQRTLDVVWHALREDPDRRGALVPGPAAADAARPGAGRLERHPGPHPGRGRRPAPLGTATDRARSGILRGCGRCTRRRVAPRDCCGWPGVARAGDGRRGRRATRSATASTPSTSSGSPPTGPRRSAGRRRTPTRTATRPRSSGCTAATDRTTRWTARAIACFDQALADVGLRRRRALRRAARLLRLGDDDDDGALPRDRPTTCPTASRSHTGRGTAAASAGPRSPAASRRRCPRARAVCRRRSTQPTIRYGAGIAASCSAYQSGLLVLPTSRVVPASTGSSRPSARGRRAPPVDGRVDDDLDVVLPADREVVLQHRHRVEAGRRRERAVEHLHAARPGRSGRPAGRPRGRPAQQVPPAVADDDRPRVDLGAPLRAGLRAVAQPHRPVLRAGLHQHGGDRRVGPGGGASGAGAVVRRTASACAATGSGSARTILPRALPTGSVGSPASWWPSSTAITRPSASAGAEHQRRQPDAAADPVTAVRPADRLDRDAGLAQDPDVAPGGPLGDAELVGRAGRR